MNCCFSVEVIETQAGADPDTHEQGGVNTDSDVTAPAAKDAVQMSPNVGIVIVANSM